MTLIQDRSELTEQLQDANDSIVVLDSMATQLMDDNEFLVENLKTATTSLEESTQKITELEQSLATANQTIEKLNSDMESLKKSNKSLSDKVKQAEDKKQAQVSRGSVKGVSGTSIYMSSTAYTAYCNGCSGKTATGQNLRANPNMKVIAVDPKVIPLGTKVHVEGYGYAIAGDTGGAIKGNKIDVFIPEQSNALQWGRKNVKVTILK